MNNENDEFWTLIKIIKKSSITPWSSLHFLKYWTKALKKEKWIHTRINYKLQSSIQFKNRLKNKTIKITSAVKKNSITLIIIINEVIRNRQKRCCSLFHHLSKLPCNSILTTLFRRSYYYTNTKYYNWHLNLNHTF